MKWYNLSTETVASTCPRERTDMAIVFRIPHNNETMSSNLVIEYYRGNAMIKEEMIEGLSTYSGAKEYAENNLESIQKKACDLAEKAKDEEETKQDYHEKLGVHTTKKDDYLLDYDKILGGLSKKPE